LDVSLSTEYFCVLVFLQRVFFWGVSFPTEGILGCEFSVEYFWVLVFVQRIFLGADLFSK
jgi:hypothetical protein